MKLYATDFDGTLTNRPLDDTLKDAIRAWQAAGHLFGIVSGRPYLSIYDTVKAYGIPYDFLIANNGAIITDGEGKRIRVKPFTPRAVLALMDSFAAAGLGGVRFDVPETYFQYAPLPDCALTEDGQAVTVNGEILPEITEITVSYPDHESTVREAAAAEEKTAHAVKGLLNSPQSVDYVPGGVNKAQAIKDLCTCLCITPEVIYTTGDSFNDLAMLTCPDFEGYAVENALPEVKEAVGRVIPAPIDILIRL